MKMKKGLLMVVLLLALSSIMAAMSYTSATVTSAMSGTVVSTNAALLALEKGTHKATTIENGMLNINLDKGNKPKGSNKDEYGIQRNSEYIWNNLFKVTNNSENDVRVKIKTSNSLPNGVTLYVGNDKGWTKIDNYNDFTMHRLDNGDSTNINVKVVVSDNADMGNFAPNLVVSGEAR